MKREQMIGLCVLLFLTAGTIFTVSQYPAEQGEALSDGERAYLEMLEAAPLAVVEGETISPDQRFLVRAVGATTSMSAASGCRRASRWWTVLRRR